MTRTDVAAFWLCVAALVAVTCDTAVLLTLRAL